MHFTVANHVCDWLFHWLWWGVTVSELRPPTGLLFILRVICELGEPWWCRLAITPGSSTRALGSHTSRDIWGKREEWTKEWEFCQSVSEIPQGILHRKILQNGTSGFTSDPKEGVLRIFTALKNPSSRPGLNPRPLGPVASTLTTTPPRRQSCMWGQQQQNWVSTKM
jgi:hypothetical protein